MGRYTVEINGKTFDVDADTPAAAALAAHQVASTSPKAKAQADASRRAANTPGAVRALTNGFGFNAVGKLDALSAAAETGIHNAIAHATGQPDAGYGMGDAYGAVRDAEAGQAGRFASEHPVVNTAAGIIGALVNPVNRGAGKYVAGAAGLPQAVGRSALTGGAIGGAYGLGGSQPENRVGDTLSGALSGAAMGAVLPPAFAVGGKIVRPLVDRARAVAARGSAEIAPPPVRAQPAELRAARALDRAVQRDTTAGTVPRPGSIPFHTHGDNVAAIAEVLAQSPGPAQTAVRSAANNSRVAARANIKSAIGEGMGGRGDYFEHLDNLFENRSTVAKAGMANMGDHLVTLDDNSVSALRSDLSRSAIKDAAANALASPDPEVRSAGAALNRLHDQLLDKPSAVTIRVRDAQDISKALLDGANSAFKAGDGARGTALKTLGKAVRTNAADPERGGFEDYGKWLKQYGDDSENIEALELGRGVFSNTLDNSPEKLARTLDEMGGPAKEHFRKGVGEALLSEVRRKGVVSARNLLKDEDFAAKVRLAYPTKEGFDAFMALAEDAVHNENRNAQILMNSRTDARGAARADLNAEGLDPTDVLADAVTLNPAGLARSGVKAAIKSLPRRDRSLIGDQRTNALLGKAVTSQDEMTRLLNLLEIDRQRAISGARSGGYIAPAAAQLPNSRR